MNSSLRNNAQIFIVSLLMLFAEIALIRWVSTESRIFAYVNNLVLLACFLGIGIGCYYSMRRTRMAYSILALLTLIIMINLPLSVNVGGNDLQPFRDIPLLLGSFTDSIIWGEPNVTSLFWPTLLGMIFTLVIFALILIVFVPIGQILGSALNRHGHPIVAYSVNILASIFGIWFFALFSFLYLPPIYWFTTIAIMFFVLYLILDCRPKSDIYFIIISLIIIIPVMIFSTRNSEDVRTVWSPYQKLELREFIDKYAHINRGYAIDVNNVGYMTLLNLSDDFVRNNPLYFNTELRRFSQYDIPYQFKTDIDDVLILGAGAGNDAAGALRNGAGSIDAVEIDPGIYRLGLEYHPERPYQDESVSVIIDDARSFLKRTDKKYDIISFGLLDAHILASSYNNTRIDHYVYTVESFADAAAQLKDDGLLTVIFEAQRPWIEKRIFFLLDKVFGVSPLTFKIKNGGTYGWGGTMYIISPDMSVISDALDADRLLKLFVKRNQCDFSAEKIKASPIRLTTDDWPYLYLEKAKIPNMHVCLIILLALLFVVARKSILIREQKCDFHFFFLGAAFLLLEFQNISKSTLLFGSTWLVNGLIITAILVLILLANIFVAVRPLKNLRTVYILLILSILLASVIPLNTFNFLGYWSKSIVAGFVLNLPVFFGGMIFIYSFRKAPHKDLAFGSNLIGAAAGGLLESAAFLTGIKALLLIVLGFYLLSWYFMKRR